MISLPYLFRNLLCPQMKLRAQCLVIVSVENIDTLSFHIRDKHEVEEFAILHRSDREQNWSQKSVFPAREGKKFTHLTISPSNGLPDGEK